VKFGVFGAENRQINAHVDDGAKVEKSGFQVRAASAHAREED